jgi:hypothetical protein
MIDISRQKQAEQQSREQYQLVLEMSDTLLQQALELKRYSQSLEERVRERTNELHEAHMDAIYMLAVASEAKDTDTGAHVRRVQNTSRDLAKQIGFSTAEADAIGYSSILHDVGKIHVPDDILGKPGPSTSANVPACNCTRWPASESSPAARSSSAPEKLPAPHTRKLGRQWLPRRPEQERNSHRSAHRSSGGCL